MNKAEKQAAAESLRNEATVLRQTRENYKEARANIEEKLKVLAEREQTKSVIWQKQYQEALKQQLDTAIDALSTKNYSNIHQYLSNEYENGFIGTMYSMQKQGIPLAMPIDQRRVVKMVETTGDNMKLSKKLYGNTTKLKNAVRREVSIGLASGESYEAVAGRLSRTMGIDYNKTIRIARTEGGRVQNASRFDAMIAAKKSGADIVKQWDSTLDNVTRPAHRELDGQIRELDEMFEAEGQQAKHPHGFGVAWMDINCRCVVVQRARWAIDGSNPDFEQYTKWDRNAPIRISEDGKSISQLIDLSDAKNFNAFKARYKEVSNNLVQQLAAAQIGIEVLGETPLTINREAAVYSTLEEKHIDGIAEMIEKAPNKKVAEVYTKYEANLTMLDSKYKGHEHFTNSGKIGVNMNVERSFNDVRQGKLSVYFHENGHQIDYVSTGLGNTVEKFRATNKMPKDMYASVAYKDNLFGKTIAKEVDELAKVKQKELKAAWTRAVDELDFDWMRENVGGGFGKWEIDNFQTKGATAAEIKKSSFFKARTNKGAGYSAIEKEIRELPSVKMADLSDIMEGATSGKVQAGWGHGKSYWKKQDDWAGVKHAGVSKEAFAEFFSASTSNPESLEILKQYLPESSKVFDEIIEAILKGEFR